MGAALAVRFDRWVKEAFLGGWLHRLDILFCLSAFVVVVSLLLGGATHGGFLSDTLVQFAAVPLLLVALWRLSETPLTNEIRLPLVFCAALALLPLLQLVPLPPFLWTALPNRGPSEAAFSLSGQQIPWMPISVSPQETWLCFLALIAPIAIFLSTLLLSYRRRRSLSLVVIAVGTLSVFVGLMQVAQGPNSPLRFFEVTNPTEAVGFFANRNHFAAFLYSLLLLASAWAVNAAINVGNLRTSEFRAGPIIAVVAGFTLLVVLLAGEAMARSRAGLVLTIVALIGAFALGFTDRRVGKGMMPNKLLLAAVALTAIFATQYALYRILERFDVDVTQDWRLDFSKHTIEAAKAYMPIGSGLGSFVPVYALFETPKDTLANTFANHAHNDILEFWLEAGILSLALMLSFGVWFVFRAVQIWQTSPPRAGALDWCLARAATLVVALIVAHSFVDYPLRAGAMTTMFAFACGLMIDPLVLIEEPPAPRVEPRKRRRKRAKLPPLLQTPEGAPHPPASPTAKWGGDIKWPEEWTKASSSRMPTGSSDGSES
jgi:O-antigen ligase